MTKEELQKFSDNTLRNIIATVHPNGSFWQEYQWAKEELDKRKVDYSDCLEPNN